MLPFGQTLRLWRTHRGLTQAQLARAAAVPRPNLCAIERGHREVSLTTLRALALSLEVSPGTLVDGLPPPQPGGLRRLSREAIERVADAAHSGPLPDDPAERALGELLCIVTSAARGGRRRAEAAWLGLKATYPPELVETLLRRVAARKRQAGHES